MLIGGKWKWHLFVSLACICSAAFAADMKWKIYGEAKMEQKADALDVRFDPASLSGIQMIAELDKGEHQISAAMSGEGRVFFGIFCNSNKKWIYSPDFKLTAEKKTFRFSFRVDSKERYLIVLLARKKTSKNMTVSRIWLQPAGEKKAAPAAAPAPASASANPFSGLPEAGLVSASFARTAPVIDGKLDDRVWKENSVTLTPFLTHKTMRPAKEKTAVLIAYDKEHLYLGFRGEALALQTRSNQFASFIQTCVRNDDPQIFNDDYFAFLIADPESGAAFDFFSNAKGVFADSKTSFANLWKDRDVKWDSGAKVCTHIEDGAWTMEAAIPWKSLGFSADQGRKFRFHAGRSNVRLREKSSWQFVKNSFHTQDAMGHLVLGGENPAVRITELPLVPLKSCRFEAQTPNSSLVLHQEANGSAASSAVNDGKLSAVLNVGDSYSIRYRYSISDPSSKSLLVCSPRYEIFADFPQLAVTGDSVPVYVNGEEVGAKPANGITVLLGGKPGEGGKSLAFSKEVNQIAFELKNDGAAFPQMMLRGKTLSPADTFLYSKSIPDSAKNGAWRLAAFDDSEWTPADMYSPLKKGFYRKKFLSETTVVGPNWNENSPLYINAGMVQPLLVYPSGIKGADTPNGCHLIVETPVSLELLGASCFYRAFPSAVVEEKRLGGTKRRYRIAFPNCVRYQDLVHAMHQWCCLPFRAADDAAGNAVIYCFWETPDGRNTLVPRTVPVRFLPKLNPAKISGILQFWTWPLNDLRDTRLADAMFNSILQTGANEIEDGRADAGKYSFRKITLAGWSLDFGDFIKARLGTALIRDSGKPHNSNACPLAILSPEGQKHLHKAFLRYLAQRPVHPIRVIWDFESSAWTGLAACYCQNCRQTFAAKFKLEKVPENIQEIRKKHAAEWIRFQTENCAEIIKLVHREALQVKIPFSVYSGYHNAFTKENYSIDWSLLAGNIELAVCGYGQSGKALAGTISALAPTPLLNSLILQPYSITNPTPPAPISSARILKTVLDSNSNGAMLFQYFLMDGRTFSAIAEVSRIMAENERFLAAKAAEGWKSSCPDIHFRQSGNEVRIIAVNDSPAEQEYNFTAPDGKSHVLKLPPNGIVLKLYDISAKRFAEEK